MKKLTSSLAMAVFLAGCSTPTSTVTYDTLATTGVTVNSAYSAYLDLVVKGTVPTNSVPAISAAFNDFQGLYAAALAVAQFNPTNPAPANVAAAASNLVSKINAAEGK